MVAMIRSIVLILFLFLVALEGLPQSKYSLGKKKNLFKVDKILVHGVKKVEPEAILEKIGVRSGMVVDNYLIREDIQRIYEMKHFSTVEVHHEIRKKKNILIFRVQEKPIINKISIKGNKNIDTDEIIEQLKTKKFNILDINTLKNDVSTLQKFYEEKGFFLVVIDFSVIKKSNETAEVQFRIQEFDKVLVKKITILGNEKFSDEQLKAFMMTREESLFSPLSGSGNFKEFDFKTDIERIKYFYKTKGYLQVNVATPQITVSKDKKWIFITFEIVEGSVFSINKIIFNGKILFSEEEMLKKLKSKPGRLYSEKKLRDDILTLTELWQDKGYAFANVLRNVEIVPGKNEVNLKFSFEKGNITHFGKISIKGNTKTRDKVIRRELKIYEGMKYSGSKMRKSKENVNRLGFFKPESIIFNTTPSEVNPNVLDVEIQIKERNTGQLSFGAGYSTASGPSFQGSISQNNFRGLGQNLRLNIQSSEDVYSFQLSFTEPYIFDSQWSGGIDLFKDKNATGEDQSVENKGFSLRIGYLLFEFTRVFIAYKYINTQVSNVDDGTIEPDVENGPASIIEGTLVRDLRNNRFEPSQGSFMSISTEYAGLGFDKKWAKMDLDTRFYSKIIGDLVFRYRLTAGRIFLVGGRKIPRSIKFFLGGPRNMRGYSLKDLGPQKKDKDRKGFLRTFAQGGISSLYSTVELEYPLVREAGIKGVIFADAGNVYKDVFSTQGESFLRYDYGFGFRWFSPIGVLRFEFGYPVKKKEGESPSQFFFDIGQLF